MIVHKYKKEAYENEPLENGQKKQQTADSSDNSEEASDDIDSGFADLSYLSVSESEDENDGGQAYEDDSDAEIGNCRVHRRHSQTNDGRAGWQNPAPSQAGGNPESQEQQVAAQDPLNLPRLKKERAITGSKLRNKKVSC